MATQYSGQGNVMQDSGVSLNNDRRIFNFGERVAELAPEQSPFFTYLSKVAKKPTDDPVFKFLEKRHQWQRRNFQTTAALNAALAWNGGDKWDIADGDGLFVGCLYDKYGRETSDTNPANFLVGGANQMIAIEAVYNDGANKNVIAYYKLSGDAASIDSTTATDKTDIKVATFVKAMFVSSSSAALAGEVTPSGSQTLTIASGKKGQLIGSSWAEATLSPDGWKDDFYNREGYCQIFKTAVPLFSGTALATRYRGDANEYMRVYQEKLMEHKMDIEHALLFGVGASDEAPASGGPARKTWGIVPYTEVYGKTKVFTNASTYDDFIDAMEDVFSPESGNSGDKLVLCSRKVLTWLNKLGTNSFLGNTMALGHKATTSGGSNPYMLDIQNIKGAFGHMVTKVNTLYGNLHFVADHLFRGPWEQYAVMVDLKNVAYRPLAANGYSRDTFIETNVQANDMDGRKDMIITEAGLEISLPETHTVLKFYNL